MGSEGTHDYSELASLIGDICDEAINSQMSRLGFSGSTHSGFTGQDPSGSTQLNISPVGGRYEGSTFVTGGQVTNAITGQPALWVIPQQGWPFNDFPSLVKYYEDTITELFMPWLQLPDPAHFKTAVDDARQGTQLISFSPQLTPGKGCVPFGANGDLRHLTTMQQKFATFRGAAMNVFLDDYANLLPIVLGNQTAAAFMVWTGVAGEQSVWQNARDSVTSIAASAVEAMKGARGEGGGSILEALLTVVGAVALIAAPFTDGLSLAAEGAVEAGTAAASAAPKALNAVGVVLQTSATFIKEPAEQEKKDLSGGNPVEVVGKIHDALEELNNQIKREEQNLATGMSGLVDVLTGGGFDMTSPALVHDDTPGDFGSRDEIKAEYDDIIWIADTIIPEVVTIISNSSKALDGVLGSGPWGRPASIGNGAIGPYSEWSSVAQLLSNQIGDSATQLSEAGDVLDLIVHDFKLTDAQIKADLDAQAAKIERTREGAFGGGGH